MLRFAEFGADRQAHFATGRFREVIARDLVLTVGLGFGEVITPAEIETGQLRFFLDLADGRGQRVFAATKKGSPKKRSCSETPALVMVAAYQSGGYTLAQSPNTLMCVTVPSAARWGGEWR